MHVPSARTLGVLDDNFKGCEVDGGNGVEGDVEKDEGPFEEGVDGVRCA
jgi:hypothetical protein